MSAPLSSDFPVAAPLDATRRALFDVAGLYDVASQLLGLRDAAVIASRVVLSAIGTLRVQGGALYRREADGAYHCLSATALEWPREVATCPRDAEQRLVRAGVVERGEPAAEAVCTMWPEAAAVSAIAYGDTLLGVLVLGPPLVAAPAGEGLDRHLVAAFAGLAARALHAAAAGDEPRPDVAGLQRRYLPLRAFHGSSAALRDVCEQLVSVAAAGCAVLVSGEPGSGRLLAARVLHHLSPRADGPWGEVDCALLSPGDLERALFGEAAHDGAEATPGLCRLHAGGTLVLTHVESLAPHTQDAVARVLQQGTVTRLGEQCAERVDVRLVAIAAADLRADTGHGRLREDVAYRLSAFHVRVPSLAERDDDVPAMLAQFLATAADAHARPSWQVPAETLQAIRRLRFPGQAGELRRLASILARVAAHDTRLTPLHVESAARELEGAARR